MYWWQRIFTRDLLTLLLHDEICRIFTAFLDSLTILSLSRHWLMRISDLRNSRARKNSLGPSCSLDVQGTCNTSFLLIDQIQTHANLSDRYSSIVPQSRDLTNHSIKRNPSIDNSPQIISQKKALESTMATPSLTSTALSLPPSAVAFCPSHTAYYVVGTYFLHPNAEQPSKAPQKRTGTLELYCLEGTTLYVTTCTTSLVGNRSLFG
jgi:hypothetical protein